MKSEHAGREKKRVMVKKKQCKSTEGTEEKKGKREEVKTGKQEERNTL